MQKHTDADNPDYVTVAKTVRSKSWFAVTMHYDPTTHGYVMGQPGRKKKSEAAAFEEAGYMAARSGLEVRYEIKDVVETTL